MKSAHLDYDKTVSILDSIDYRHNIIEIRTQSRDVQTFSSIEIELENSFPQMVDDLSSER